MSLSSYSVYILLFLALHYNAECIEPCNLPDRCVGNYCATDCSLDQPCTAGRQCVLLNTVDPISVCLECCESICGTLPPCLNNQLVCIGYSCYNQSLLTESPTNLPDGPIVETPPENRQPTYAVVDPALLASLLVYVVGLIILMSIICMRVACKNLRRATLE